ncbi:bifunctional DNA-binding transcriptional regulator/O6-methylguanine-DNA methyltransferase Ada [Martelella alba]|uniref:Bifunctional DNA-binding transcriptional regulator/O6-methylguanine-DNA methyltransferase Ada n=1 Tax=Martelella alba TaxID=2590451 RepID=A0ABY2SID1_9HYPH|nr:bifunctional DNA-binding transcriptional regulator/O6-methylguanine-DNA methyltransferase Ada [Martelella alba]
MRNVETVPMTSPITDPRWQAIANRDKAADGQFVYGVKTTGVYCAPSCPSRRPRPENVRYFPDAAAAEQAGFRPCKRCRQGRPSLADEQAAKIALACRYIEQAAHTPTLAEIAGQAGLSPYHCHRLFKNLTGLTPRRYASACRHRRLRQALEHQGSVTDAILSAGYPSAGQVYHQSEALLGMTPGAYRAGGRDTDILFAVGQCSLGAILVARSARGICAILLGDDPQALTEALQDKFPHARLAGDDPVFNNQISQVVGFVDTPRLGLHLPLDIRGTAFQQRVWLALLAIPPGETLSYREVAQRIGAPEAVRAVAGACAANILAVAIPCHRVVRSDGGLSGYRWGVERKRQLLDKEKHDAGLSGI